MTRQSKATQAARRGVVMLALLAGAWASAPPAGAAEAPRALRLVSTPSSGNVGALFLGTSADGSRVIFTTTEAIPGTGDADTADDVYERDADGTLRLVSTPNSGAVGASFRGASADGRRVFFETTEATTVGGDTDAANDVYERDADGTLRLISTPLSGAVDAVFAGASADGSRVFFTTTEAIAGTGDADTANDVYERDADGTLRLVTTPNSGANDAVFGRASADGSRVFFTTTEAIAGTGDADTANDVYERDADGTLRLISTPSSGAVGADFAAASADGARVFFTTREAIAGSGDADTAFDIYERDTDGTLRLITTPNSGADDVRFRGASVDGSRVFFTTTEAIAGTGDADSANDVYARDADGTLRLISTPNSGGLSAFFDGASADGSRVFFDTGEAISGTGDADTVFDIYARDADGTLRLISTPTSAAGMIATFGGVSADGARAFFSTTEAIAATGDTDTGTDVYERDADGTLRLISTPNSGLAAAYFDGTSADASRVFFHTDEAIAGSGDSDTGRDVYERSWTAPTFSSDARVSGTPAAGSALACVPGEIVGEGFATRIAWLRDGAPITGAIGASYPVVAADVDHGLACRVTATNPIGSATQTSLAVAVPMPATPVRGDTTAPRLSSLQLVHKRFRIGPRRTAIVARAPKGTIIRFQLSEPATTRIAILRERPGRRSGGRCVRPTALLKRARRCIRSAAAGTLTRASCRGTNLVAFSGRLGTRALKPGRYRVQLRATDAARNTSNVVSARFTVVHG